MNEAFELSVRGHLFRVQPPETESPRAILLAVHGFTGDELSMEIFTRTLRRYFWVIYPRAPHAAQDGGFSWVETSQGYNQPASDFLQEAQELFLCLDLLSSDLGIGHLPLFSMGFSQGATLALIYSTLFSQPHTRHALLAGFLPGGLAARVNALRQRFYFVAHGSHDATVPFEQSHQIVNYLQESGAEIQFCQSNTAHKLSLECLRVLENFFLNEPSAFTGPG